MPLLFQRYAKTRNHEKSDKTADVIAVANAQVSRLTVALRRAECEIDALRGTSHIDHAGIQAAPHAPTQNALGKEDDRECCTPLREELRACQAENESLQRRVAELESRLSSQEQDQAREANEAEHGQRRPIPQAIPEISSALELVAELDHRQC